MMLKSTTPKGDTYYKGRAKNYEKRRLKQEWWHTEQDEMKSLLESIPDRLSVLDVPFGTGRFVPFYNDRGFSIFGLDASNEMIEAAQKSLGPLFDTCKCSVGDAASLPYSDGQFDLVVSTRFLRDIVPFGTAKKMLSEMVRVSSRFLIVQLGSSPDVGSVPADHEVWGGRMSQSAVDELLADHGLTVLDRRLVLSGPEVGNIHHILVEKKSCAD
ncbi:MAG: class I SAM-dependent methyltransferase [Loktanella sp.]|nr:class I SAM-dependent methyltransferase [Loktanella sp.]